MISKKQIGDFGEKTALQFLLSKGYAILEKNWKSGHLEIDIIAEKDDTIVIVEVKIRKSSDYGNPETFVDLRKQKRLIKAAHTYIQEKNLDKETRFDIISILNRGSCPEITHLENAFSPSFS